MCSYYLLFDRILLSQQHNPALPEKIIDFIIITIKFFSANEKDNINFSKNGREIQEKLKNQRHFYFRRHIFF